MRGKKSRHFPARVLISTAKDLADEAQAGRFRNDLYLKISGVELNVPGVSERLTELGELLKSATDDLALEHHRPSKTWAHETVTALMEYDWPGNIDEIRQLIACMLSNVVDETILLSHIRAFAPVRIAQRLGVAESKHKPLRDLRPEQFWFEYLVVYKSRGKDMASAYGVTEAAISQHKKKHMKLRPA